MPFIRSNDVTQVLKKPGNQVMWEQKTNASNKKTPNLILTSVDVGEGHCDDSSLTPFVLTIIKNVDNYNRFLNAVLIEFEF